MKHAKFPYQVDALRKTAITDHPGHVRDMIEQILFTNPGERVNRPDFGSGLMQVVFAPNSDELAATTNMLVQTELQRRLGDLIELGRLEVVNEDTKLTVNIQYRLLGTDERRTDTFSKEI
jgi:phage baseplate assembly protein W